MSLKATNLRNNGIGAAHSQDAAKSIGGGSIIQEVDAHKSLLFPEKTAVKDPKPVTQETVSVPPAHGNAGENSAIKLEEDGACLVGNQLVHSRSVLVSNPCEGELKKDNASSVDCSEDSKSMAMDDGSCHTTCLGTKAQDCPKQTSLEGDQWVLNKSSSGVENSTRDIVSNSSISLIELGLNRGSDAEHNHPTSSGMTDSTNESGSMMHGKFIRLSESQL
ncbi:protein NLP9-like [Sesbania bispinosa]|nr:protein NLP9-like [Sesbania bispinosa]